MFGLCVVAFLCSCTVTRHGSPPKCDEGFIASNHNLAETWGQEFAFAS